MFWIFVLIFLALFVACWVFISRLWGQYTADPLGLGLQSLFSYNALSRVWPTDGGFLSLKFSALRHTVAGIVSAALIWFADVGILNTVLLAANAVYSCLVYLRYRARADDYKTAGLASQRMLLPVKRACLSVLLLSVLDWAVLSFAYGFRP